MIVKRALFPDILCRKFKFFYHLWDGNHPEAIPLSEQQVGIFFITCSVGDIPGKQELKLYDVWCDPIGTE